MKALIVVWAFLCSETVISYCIWSITGSNIFWENFYYYSEKIALLISGIIIRKSIAYFPFNFSVIIALKIILRYTIILFIIRLIWEILNSMVGYEAMTTRLASYIYAGIITLLWLLMIRSLTLSKFWKNQVHQL